VSDPDVEAGQDRRLEYRIDPASSAGPLELLPALRDLTTFLLAAATVEDVLGRVVVTARHAIPGADLVSITIRHDDGTLETPTGTGPEAAELDQAQYRAGTGPCVDAADPDGPAYARSNDLASEAAWPTFAASATAHGYASVLSTALLSGPEPVPFTGALNIYSRETEGFDDSARDLAFLLATHASLALVAAHTRQSLTDAEDTVVNLRRALDSRTVIGQATGILMAHRNLTADQAFDVLNRTSQNHNIKLARLAELLTNEPDIADKL
jgi:transcriptional regulator with GAF, ATPase, and Fis domain